MIAFLMGMFFSTQAYQIAREIKEKIENELKYPGTIKVTVIRETRCTEEAK